MREWSVTKLFKPLADPALRSFMSSQIICPHCSHSFEIDEDQSPTRICAHCGQEWAVDGGDEVDEVEDADEIEYEFEAANYDTVASDQLAANEAESIGTGWTESDNIDSSDNKENQADAIAESDESEVDETTHDWQRIAAKPRPKRQEASLLSKIVPPILGGLSAIPISIAILWYGMGRDLGNAGPTVAQYVPWVVPEALRGPQQRKFKTYQDTDPSMRGNRDFGVLGGRSKDFPNLSRSKPQTRIDDSLVGCAVVDETSSEDEPSSIEQTPDESMIAGDPSLHPSDESVESAVEESLGRSSLGPTEEMLDKPASNRTEVAVEVPADVEVPAEMEPSDAKPLDLSLLDSILKEPSSDTDILQRTDAIVESIRSMRDTWESEPSRTWNEREWDIYQETLRLAEIWLDSIATSDTSVYIPDSFRMLLETDWYRESLQEAASGRFAELYPPEVFELVVWPVRSISTEAIVAEVNIDSEGICLADPLLSIGSRVAQWKISDEAVASRIREMGERPEQAYWLIIGRVEQVDEQGIVIRIEGLLP